MKTDHLSSSIYFVLLTGILSAASCNDGILPPAEEISGIDTVGQEIVIDPIVPKSIPVTVSASPEHPESRTSLDGSAIRWSESDAFSMLGTGIIERTVTSEALTLLSCQDLSSMKNGDSKTIMISSVSSSGYKIGSSGQSWSGVKNSSYSKDGTGITSEQASANELQLKGEMADILESSDASKFKFTVTRTSSGFRFRNKDDYYFTNSKGSLSLDATGSDFSIENPTGTSSSTCFVRQNTSSSIVNPNIIRIFSGYSGKNYYFRSGSAAPSLSTDNGSGWNLYYIYEVNDVTSGTETVEYPFNNKFSISGPSNGTFTGEVLEGSDCNIAVYPYREEHTLSSGMVCVSLPQVQQYAVNSFSCGAFPMVGYKTADDRVYFRCLFGLLRLSITGSGTVRSVEIEDRDNSVNLWGTARIAASDILGDNITCSISGGSNKVILDCGTGVALQGSNPVVFYIALPVGAFSSGFVVTLDSDRGRVSKSATKVTPIKRSVQKNMSPLDIASFSMELPTYNIMNDKAWQYFSTVTYTESDMDSGTGRFPSDLETKPSGTPIATLPDRPDQPKPVVINWISTLSGTATVELFSDASYSNLVDSGTAAVSSGTYSFVDLLPEKTYYYRVTAGGEVLTSGGFKTTGQVRMIKLDSGWNIRDLGGWTALGGKKIKYEKLYRGGQIERLTEAEQQRFNHLDITAEADFRAIDATSEGSVGMYQPHPIALEDTKLISDHGTVMYFHKSCDSEQRNIMSVTSSSDMKKNAQGDYVMHMAFIIDAVLSDHPTYFHCKSGADRTGVFGLLVEGLLGVDPCDAVKDYELTNFTCEYDYRNGSWGDVNGARKYRSGCDFYNAYKAISNNTIGAPSSYDTFQKRCYYYFNNCLPKKINASDLDAFIKAMLGMTEAEYSQYRPSGTYDGGTSNSLKSVYYWPCGHSVDHGWK